MINKICIIGCGGHSKSIMDILKNKYPSINIVFYDENAKPGELHGGMYCVKNISELRLEKNNSYFVAIGDNEKREQIYKKIQEYEIATIISKDSFVSSYAEIDRGSFIGNMVHIGPETNINEDCIINTGSIVEHECIIGAHSHISVGSKVCGRSQIGKRVFLGAGAIVIDKLKICDDVTIGAGSVVVSDIDIPGVYVGVPARRI